MTTPAPTDLRALDIGRFKPAARKLLAGAAALSLALTGLAQAPAEAAPKAKVDIAIPTQRSIDASSSYKLSNGGVAVFSYNRGSFGWWTTSNGTKWSQPKLPGWAIGVETFDMPSLVQGADGKDYFVSFDRWDTPRAARVQFTGAAETKLNLPSDISDIAVLPAGAVYAVDYATPTFYSFDSKAKTPIAGFHRVDGIRSASNCQFLITGELEEQTEDGDYATGQMLFDGCTKTSALLSTLPSGRPLWNAVVVSDKAYALDYDSASDKPGLCSTAVTNSTTWGCHPLSDKYNSRELTKWGLLENTHSDKTGYTFRLLGLADSKVLWSSLNGQCDANFTGIVCIDKSNKVYLPTTSSIGKAKGALPRVQAEPIPAGFSGDKVLIIGSGDTSNELFTATVAKNGKSASKAKRVSTKSPGVVLASGARSWVNGSLYDRGKAVSGAKKLPGRASAVSGPYALTTSRAKSTSTTTVYRVDGKKLKKLRTLKVTDNKAGEVATALFGSRVLVTSLSKDGTPTKHRVLDAETGKTIATRKSGERAFGMWGDEVYLLKGKTVKKWNYVTGKVKSLGHTWSNYVTAPSVSDGVAYLSGRLVNTATGKTTDFSPDRASGVTVYNNKAAYSVDTKTGPKVRVDTLAFGGKSAPRLLGTVADASFKKGKTWKADFDLTKPLKKGTLVITDKKGKKVRSIALPATSDGSYRNVKWNGKDSKGKYVKPGTYTWTIKATDDPTRKGLKKGQTAKAIDGKKAASGTVKLKK